LDDIKCEEVAVLLLIFNRPISTSKVMSALGAFRPLRLYVAADGPRIGYESERELCQEARRIATSVNWPCEIRTLWRDTNNGCKRAVSGAIDWFFEYEEEGLILEDDCIPHIDFFKFCAHGLNRYRDDRRVYVITGDNFQDGVFRGESGASYYFSKYPHCWGWATWRRAWRAYDARISFWRDWMQTSDWQAFHRNPIEREQWELLAAQVCDDSLDSWATPWMFSVWYHGGLTMTPNVNLVTNIGFGFDATHTINSRDNAAALPVYSLGRIHDASNVVWDQIADEHVFLFHFGGRNLMFPRNLVIWVKRVLVRMGQAILGFKK
jgi:hypothetical protein